MFYLLTAGRRQIIVLQQRTEAAIICVDIQREKAPAVTMELTAAALCSKNIVKIRNLNSSKELGQGRSHQGKNKLNIKDKDIQSGDAKVCVKSVIFENIS